MLQRRSFVVVALGLLLGPLPTNPAAAQCHSFSFSQDSYPVSEDAGSVSLVVSRDGTVDDSSVKFNTVNGTAKSPQDYSKSSGTIPFTGSEQEKSITITIKDDKTKELTEEFTVVLQSGDGCDVNPNFQYDSATIRIQDDDQLIAQPTATPTPTPTQTATKKPKPKPSTASASPSSSPTGSPTATPTTSGSPLAQADDADGGTSSGLVVAIVVLTLVFGGIAAFWVRRRFLT
jgi:cell division septation protein DedD